MTKLIVAASLLAALVSGTAASAGLVRVTLTGSTENIRDNADVFHLGGNSMAPAIITDQAFVETFLVDTSVNPNGSGTGVSSNSIFDAAPPFAVAGALTINGRTFATAGSNYSGAYIAGDYQILSDDAVGRTRDDNDFYLDLTGAGLPATLSQPIRLTLAAGQVGSNTFIDASSGGTYADAIGSLTPTSFSVAAVPEPAAWTLLIAGFGMIGATVRSRRSVTA